MRKLCSECLELELGIKESGLVMPPATTRATMAPRVEHAPPATSAPAVDSQTPATGSQHAPPVEPGEEAESPQHKRDGKRPVGAAAPADSGMAAEDIDPPPPATKRGPPRGSKNKQAPARAGEGEEPDAEEGGKNKRAAVNVRDLCNLAMHCQFFSADEIASLLALQLSAKYEKQFAPGSGHVINHAWTELVAEYDALYPSRTRNVEVLKREYAKHWGENKDCTFAIARRQQSGASRNDITAAPRPTYADTFKKSKRANPPQVCPSTLLSVPHRLRN
eukprot:jgi/Tetstr1/437812/TSEL_026452.t1